MFHGYLIRPTVSDDGAALNRLYKIVSGVDRSIEAWRWEWMDGPYGAAPSWVVAEVETGEVVGHHGVVPQRLMLGSRLLKAARTENSMVHPDHRRRFMYSAFEAKILGGLLPRFDLIFTTAGGGAQGVVRKRLGYVERGHWHTFSPGPSLAHVASRATRLGKIIGPLAGLLEGRGARGLGVEETGDLERVAAVWARAEREGRLTPDRSAPFLAWRIGRHPRTRYRAGIVTSGGAEFGAAIWRRQGVAGGATILTVEDLFTIEPSRAAVRAALLALAAHYRGKAARILVRTLDDDSPLADAARELTPAWAMKGGGGSPIWVRSRHSELVAAPWTMTLLLTQGN